MDFAGRLAVVTGGGSGIGRALVIELVARGCAVATCDVHDAEVAETVALALDRRPDARVTAHHCDVADERQVEQFRDDVLDAHERDPLHFLFNVAGVTGGYSFLATDRTEWDRTFAICWAGTYHCCRAFVPLIVASDAGYVVNTSSVNGLWAALGPEMPHSAYSTAKFAVRGFTESLIVDLRVNAPHVKAAVVMPGHVDTGIRQNSLRIIGDDGSAATPATGTSVAIEAMAGDDARSARTHVPFTPDDAARVILDAVHNDEWRILIGADARTIDKTVRADPNRVYAPDGLSITEVWAQETNSG